MINTSQTLVLNKRIITLIKGMMHSRQNNQITWITEKMCVLSVMQYVSKTNRFKLDAIEYFLLVDIEPEKFSQFLSTREYLELRKVAHYDNQYQNTVE